MPSAGEHRYPYQKFTALAEELGGTARADLWPKLIASAPSVGEFQAKTTHRFRCSC